MVLAEIDASIQSDHEPAYDLQRPGIAGEVIRTSEGDHPLNMFGVGRGRAVRKQPSERVSDQEHALVIRFSQYLLYGQRQVLQDVIS